jgi:hypothetical protein
MSRTTLPLGSTPVSLPKVRQSHAANLHLPVGFNLNWRQMLKLGNRGLTKIEKIK